MGKETLIATVVSIILGIAFFVAIYKRREIKKLED